MGAVIKIQARCSHSNSNEREVTVCKHSGQPLLVLRGSNGVRIETKSKSRKKNLKEPHDLPRPIRSPIQGSVLFTSRYPGGTTCMGPNAQSDMWGTSGGHTSASSHLFFSLGGW